MRPTTAQLREVLVAMLTDTPEHAWATPTIQAAFAWRESQRVVAQLRALAAAKVLGCTVYGSPIWWWTTASLTGRRCGVCHEPATCWEYGAVEHSWQVGNDDREWIPGTGGWCCGTASCRAVTLGWQYRTLERRAAERAAAPM